MNINLTYWRSDVLTFWLVRFLTGIIQCGVTVYIQLYIQTPMYMHNVHNVYRCSGFCHIISFPSAVLANGMRYKLHSNTFAHTLSFATHYIALFFLFLVLLLLLLLLLLLPPFLSLPCLCRCIISSDDSLKCSIISIDPPVRTPPLFLLLLVHLHTTN